MKLSTDTWPDWAPAIRTSSTPMTSRSAATARRTRAAGPKSCPLSPKNALSCQVCPKRAGFALSDAIELIDPSLSSERLVYRLFHEPGVRVFRASPLRAECSCSRDNVEAMLKSFSQDDRDHMVEDGKISVTCEFCSAHYQFAPGDVGASPS